MTRTSGWRRALPVTVVAALIVGLVGLGIGFGSRRYARTTGSTTGAGASSGASSGSSARPGSAGRGSSGSGTTADGSFATRAPSIAAEAKRGVVAINTKLGYLRASAAGSGIVLTSSGEVLTNNHVIDGATTITATVIDTGRTYTAEVVGTNPTGDIAVLHLRGAKGLKTVTTGESSRVNPGDPVIAIGNAGGRGELSVVSGTVGAVGQTITASDQSGANAERLTNLIRTDAPLEPGDSGGPLINQAGLVIGMDAAASSRMRFESTSSAGFAIPIADALSVARRIESGQASDTIHIGLPAFLGVQVVPSGGSSDQYGDGSGSSNSSTTGAVVSRVEPGTPAAGELSEGDTITAVDREAVASAEALTTLMRKHRPGDRVTLTWTDQSGVRHNAKVTLTTGPAD